MKKILSVMLALLMILSLSSCATAPKPKDNRVVLTVSGEKIYYDYFRYVFLNTKADMDGGDDKYWTENPEKFDELKEAVLDTITHNRAIELLAKKYNVKLTKADKKNILAYLDDMKASMSDSKESLESNYLTDYTLYYVQSFTELWAKAYDKITSSESGIIKSGDTEVLADIDVNFRRIRYIMIEYDSENKDEKLALAEETLAKAQNGEDFVELVKEYGDDTTMSNAAEDGRYYTIGQLISNIEEEVEKLNENEISGIVEVYQSYIILQRLPLEDEYVEENFSDFIEMYVARVFNEMVAEIKETITVKTSQIWDNLKITDVK